ncbi:hypothetical protein PHMEG_0007445, partial [Phytophthora megakarya]
LAMAVLEWHQVISGVQFRMVSLLYVCSSRDYEEALKPEEVEDDVLLSSYEAELLVSECVTCLRKAGVRVTRSPASSSLVEPELMRKTTSYHAWKFYVG